MVRRCLADGTALLRSVPSDVSVADHAAVLTWSFSVSFPCPSFPSCPSWPPPPRSAAAASASARSSSASISARRSSSRAVAVWPAATGADAEPSPAPPVAGLDKPAAFDTVSSGPVEVPTGRSVSPPPSGLEAELTDPTGSDSEAGSGIAPGARQGPACHDLDSARWPLPRCRRPPASRTGSPARHLIRPGRFELFIRSLTERRRSCRPSFFPIQRTLRWRPRRQGPPAMRIRRQWHRKDLGSRGSENFVAWLTGSRNGSVRKRGSRNRLNNCLLTGSVSQPNSGGRLPSL